MDTKIETEIVKHYIRENKQQRILWELSLPQKRNTLFWKFAGPELFKQSCLKPTKFMSTSTLEKFLFELSGSSTVYFIGEDYIGYLSLNQASQRTQTGEICIIYCGNGIGYYQGEQGYGSPPRYLLRAQ